MSSETIVSVLYVEAVDSSLLSKRLGGSLTRQNDYPALGPTGFSNPG